MPACLGTYTIIMGEENKRRSGKGGREGGGVICKGEL